MLVSDVNLPVHLVILDLLMDQTPVRDELKSATTTSGALFVMTFGQQKMLWWPVDSLDILQQEQLPVLKPTLEEEQQANQFTWTMFSASVLSPDLSTVPAYLSVHITASTMKMLVSPVKILQQGVHLVTLDS